jgi:hypothetical protein
MSGTIGRAVFSGDQENMITNIPWHKPGKLIEFSGLSDPRHNVYMNYLGERASFTLDILTWLILSILTTCNNLTQWILRTLTWLCRQFIIRWYSRGPRNLVEVLDPTIHRERYRVSYMLKLRWISAPFLFSLISTLPPEDQWSNDS